MSEQADTEQRTDTMSNTTPEVATLVHAMKAEIAADILDGTIPSDIGSFAELHEYVDGNEYGAAVLVTLALDVEIEHDAVNEATEIVSEWLVNGRLEGAPQIDTAVLIASIDHTIDNARDEMRDLATIAKVRSLTDAESAEYEFLGRMINNQTAQRDKFLAEL